MTNPSSKPASDQNSGFIFGLTLGAAVGALSAILIRKNSKTQVIQNFESKIKDFFKDLVEDIKTQKKDVDQKIEFIDLEEEKPSPSHKKSSPKMFVKAKK